MQAPVGEERVSVSEWYGLTPSRAEAAAEWYGVAEPVAVPAPVLASEPPAPAVDLKIARRRFSRLGLGAFTILAVATALQAVIVVLLNVLGVDWQSSTAGVWIISFLPLYLAAVPLGLLIMRRVPPLRAQEIGCMQVGFGRWLIFLMVSVCAMYAGSFIGIAVNGVLSLLKHGEEVVNPVEELILSSPLWLRLLIVVIVGPIIEELIFRRFLVDRMRRYGERLAVVVSGLMFGLFHGNFSQFFYAFFLGVIFGYLYLRTGKLRLTIALHCVINFMGSIMAPALMEVMGESGLYDIEALMEADSAEILSSVGPMLLMSAYSSLVMGAAVAGLVLLIVRRKRVFFLPAPEELPRAKRFSVVWVNVGMILFVVVCAATFIYNIFA